MPQEGKCLPLSPSIEKVLIKRPSMDAPWREQCYRLGVAGQQEKPTGNLATGL